MDDVINPKDEFHSDQRISVAQVDRTKSGGDDSGDEEDNQYYLKNCWKKLMRMDTCKYFFNPKYSTVRSNCNIAIVYKYNMYIISFLCSIQI